MPQYLSTKLQTLQFIVDNFYEDQVFTPSDITLGYSKQAMNNNLNRLIESGIIIKKRRGLYLMPSRTAAVNYFITTTIKTKGTGGLDLTEFNFMGHPNYTIEGLEEIVRRMVAIRSLDIPGASMLIQEVIRQLTVDRDLIKKMISVITNSLVAPEKASETLLKDSLGPAGVGAKYEALLGVTGAEFEAIIYRQALEN